MIGFAAYSGTGKTTLLKKVIPALKTRGLRIGVVKHAHHEFEVDVPGKDSYELRKAGADQMLIGSATRWALMSDCDDKALSLEDHLEHLHQDELDIILVEGFKPYKIPKIELTRSELSSPAIHPQDDSIIAIATDEPGTVTTNLPILDINNAGEICDFIIKYFQINLTE